MSNRVRKERSQRMESAYIKVYVAAIGEIQESDASSPQTPLPGTHANDVGWRLQPRSQCGPWRTGAARCTGRVYCSVAATGDSANTVTVR